MFKTFLFPVAADLSYLNVIIDFLKLILILNALKGQNILVFLKVKHDSSVVLVVLVKKKRKEKKGFVFLTFSYFCCGTVNILGG